MVLARTVKSNNSAKLASQTTSGSGMISFETRGSTSFESREKKFSSRYSNKSRNHNNNDEFIMLQRPTPIILAKPASKDHENAVPLPGTIRSKDEDSKPGDRIIKYDPNSRSMILTGPNNIENQPILANVSTNLKPANKFENASLQSAQRVLTKETPKDLQYVHSMGQQQDATLTSRLTNAGQFMNTSVQLLDEALTWKENLSEFLTDQPDFLVVGVLGKRGSGKSTLMSLLAGSKFEEMKIFKQSGKDNLEVASHKTNGIQAFVTVERTILLDVQPLLSSSVLDKAINTDKKHLTHDFKYYENFIEMQSIELSCFILSVCNVVLVTEDWFVDPNLFRILQTAEMLMPHIVQNPEEGQWEQRYPHLVYALNNSENVNAKDIAKMKNCINIMLQDSKLIYKKSIRDVPVSSQLIKSSSQQQKIKKLNGADNVNFVVIPKADKNKNGFGEFNETPSLEKSVKNLTKEILAIKRFQSNINTGIQTNSTGFTERKWFTYANKVWDNIRKSSLMSEYNRLMT